MRIIIIGAGSAGLHLMERLCQENHSVVMIDTNAARLAVAEAHCDIMAIKGEGANPRILNKAGVSKSDLLVAVTNRDEVNLLACLYARQAGVEHRVARITEPDYVDPSCGIDLKDAGVDLAVVKSETIAEEVFHILQLPGAIEVIDLLDGKARVVGIKLDPESPLIRATLQDLDQDELLSKVRMLAVMRGEELIIPRGDTTFMIGDDVYMVTTPDYMDHLLNWACPDRPMFGKIMIAGGGDLGLRLAQLLESTTRNVILIEADEERANHCSMRLDKALVIHGDALDENLLSEIGVSSNTAFVACKGSDENNMISCLLAEKLGVTYTLARINKLEYVSIINSQSLLDRAVSPQLAVTNAILHFVRGQNIRSATLLHGLPGELLEMDVHPQNKHIDMALKNIRLPKRSVLAAVRRSDMVMIPTGDFAPRGGDQLVAFSHPSAIKKLAKLFHT